MFSLLTAATTAVVGSWTLFSEGAMLGATVYAIGRSAVKSGSRLGKK